MNIRQVVNIEGDSYAGRIAGLISPINPHSLLLMNITDLLLHGLHTWTISVTAQSWTIKVYVSDNFYVHSNIFILNEWSCEKSMLSVRHQFQYQFPWKHNTGEQRMLSYIQHLIGDVDVSTEDIDQDTETISHDPVISDIKVYTDLLAACRLWSKSSSLLTTF